MRGLEAHSREISSLPVPYFEREIQVKKFDMKVWSLWALIVLLPAGIIALSTYRSFHSSFEIIGIMLAIVVGVSAWILHNSDEPVAEIRNFGLNVKFVLSIVLFINLACHIAISRELSAAAESRTERHEEEDRAEKKRDAETKRKAQLTAAETERIRAEAEYARNEARRLAQLPVSQRKVKPGQSSEPATVDTTAATAEPTPKPEKTAVVIANADEIRQTWSPWLFLLAAIESLVAVVGGARLLKLLHWTDSNQNGVRDWVEQLSESDAQARFPGEWAKLKAAGHYNPK